MFAAGESQPQPHGGASRPTLGRSFWLTSAVENRRLHFQILNRIDELQRYCTDWRKLGVASPFTSPEWMIRWAKTFLARGSGAELFTLAAFDAGRLVGLAPWYRRRTRTHRRVLEFLGSGRVCSDHLSVVAAPGRQIEVAAELADFLASSVLRHQWDAIDLEGVDADDPAMAAFIDRCRAQQLGHVSLRGATASYWMALPESWESFLASCSKNRRKRLRRWQRRYIDSGRLQQSVATEAHQVPALFATLVELHNRRRRGLGQCGAFEDADFLEFHRAVLPEMLQSRQLRLSLVELDGRPIAAEYILRDDQTWLAYQSGLDPASIEHGPGNLSLMLSVQEAIRHGARRLDFLRGEEPYKLAWGCRRREAQRIRIRRDGLAGRLEHWADRLREISSRRIKSHRDAEAAAVLRS